MKAFFSPDGLMGKLFFRAVRGFVRIFLFRWFRMRVEGHERLQVNGGVIIAPTHRSNLDGPLVGSSSHRRVRYLGKDSLFRPAAAGWAMRSLGSFPVRRGEADLDAMRVAKEMLEAGECMLVFPEGSRQEGDSIGEIYDGTAWLASKAGTPVVPVGIAGTEVAMPTGSKFPSRVPVTVVVGEVLDPPKAADGERVKRSDLKEWTEQLRLRLHECQTRAREMLNE
jgi:1-acyl-sn-glycerol-3-phosphate acyltransferase|tara:strand:- start:48 stop:719 length:672 start_codon:yes stop_codon:yes gene_type:complete